MTSNLFVIVALRLYRQTSCGVQKCYYRKLKGIVHPKPKSSGLLLSAKSINAIYT